MTDRLHPEMFVIEGFRESDSDKLVRPVISYWQDAWRRLKKNRLAMGALVLLIFLMVMVVIGPSLLGHDLVTIAAKYKNMPPSRVYPFGTDSMGRDMFGRVWLAARASMIVALVCTAIRLIIASVIGAAMAYFKGIFDEIMMRIIEVLSSIPSLLVTMLIMSILGNSVSSLLVALSAISWVGLARQVRGMVLQLRESEFVFASEALGASGFWIIGRHMLPNTIGLLILNAATSIPTIIFSEAGLSFLGLGLQNPDLSLGTLISTGQQAMEFYPFQLIYPALVLCLIVLAFNLLGDGLRDALDPRLRQ